MGFIFKRNVGNKKLVMSEISKQYIMSFNKNLEAASVKKTSSILVIFPLLLGISLNDRKLGVVNLETQNTV